MKKHIYIFDEYVSSQKNGIGTYLKELLACAAQTDSDICLLSFNANVKELKVEFDESHALKRIIFPPFPTSQFTDYATIFIKIFRLYIIDSAQNIFLINHSPCKKLVEVLKGTYTKSKIIFIIHDFSWTSAYMGDLNKYRQTITERKEALTKNNQIIERYEEEKATYELVDCIVCLSMDAYDLLVKDYDVRPEKIFHIANGLSFIQTDRTAANKKRLREKYFISENEKLILFVGRLTIQKGIYALLGAFSEVLKTHPNTHLIIAGTDTYGKMENLSKLYPYCASRISFLGLIEKELLNEWYIMSDIGVISSYYEQCTYVGIEMMMHRLPVVASDGFGIKNMFQTNVNAEVAPIGNREKGEEYIQHLADAINKLLANPNMSRKYSEAGWNVYKQYYSIEQMRKNYQLLFSTI